MNVREMEADIAATFIQSVLQAGYVVSVWEGGDYAIQHSSDAKDILDAMFSTDSDVLRMYRNTPTGYVCKASAWFVYGNSGWDVLADYSTSLEPLLTEVNALSERYMMEDQRQQAA